MTDKIHTHNSELKEKNLKFTPVRAAVMDLLEKESKPLDVATIIDYLKEKNIDADPVTVFRIMNLFTERGLIRKIELQEGKARYEIADSSDHHHFVCDNCGNIEDVSDCNIDVLEHHISKKKGLLIKRHSLEFFGLCKNCQS